MTTQFDLFGEDDAATRPAGLSLSVGTLRRMREQGYVAHDVENVFAGERMKRQVAFFDHVKRRMRDSLVETIVAIRVKAKPLPDVRVLSTDLSDRVLGVPAPDPEYVEFSPPFGELFKVYAKEEAQARRLLGTELQQALVGLGAPLAFEVAKQWLLLCRPDRTLEADEIERFIGSALSLLSHVERRIS